MAEDKTIPTWGYHPVEPARIFQLKPGEKLPEGWHDAPVPRSEEEPAESDGNSVLEASLEAAVNHIRDLELIIEQGKKENAELREELKGADEEANAAARQVKSLTEKCDQLRAQAARLVAENEQLRAGHVAPKKGK